MEEAPPGPERMLVALEYATRSYRFILSASRPRRAPAGTPAPEELILQLRSRIYFQTTRALVSYRLAASGVHWIGAAPAAWDGGEPLRCHATIRYRQPDQACTVLRTGERTLEAHFDVSQRTPTPGQFIVLYDGDRCLGGATIERGLAASASELRAAV